MKIRINDLHDGIKTDLLLLIPKTLENLSEFEDLIGIQDEIMNLEATLMYLKEQLEKDEKGR